MFAKNVSSKLYHFENSNTRWQCVGLDEAHSELLHLHLAVCKCNIFSIILVLFVTNCQLDILVLTVGLTVIFKNPILPIG